MKRRKRMNERIEREASRNDITFLFFFFASLYSGRSEHFDKKIGNHTTHNQSTGYNLMIIKTSHANDFIKINLLYILISNHLQLRAINVRPKENRHTHTHSIGAINWPMNMKIVMIVIVAVSTFITRCIKSSTWNSWSSSPSRDRGSR